MKNIILFLLFFLFENFQFLEVKFSIYLNRSVLVMGMTRPGKEPTNSQFSLLSVFAKLKGHQGCVFVASSGR